MDRLDVKSLAGSVAERTRFLSSGVNGRLGRREVPTIALHVNFRRRTIVARRADRCGWRDPQVVRSIARRGTRDGRVAQDPVRCRCRPDAPQLVRRTGVARGAIVQISRKDNGTEVVNAAAEPVDHEAFLTEPCLLYTSPSPRDRS